MKNLTITSLALLLSLSIFAQIPTYYNNVNLTLTGLALKTELANKITTTHTNLLTYSGVWTALQQTDVDPTNASNVLLIYGYDDGDGNVTTDRTRSKNNNGGNNGEWNREHTYAKSLANPSMVTNTPSAGTDAHHLRSSDVQRNGMRGSMKFATGSGNSSTVGSNWYPGDEWKGDVARMMMYMYLRYPTQCLPTNVGAGASVAIDPSMIDLFLTWNAADTVSQYEKNRNTILESQQGNRNPFIDNPYLATIIWGGTVAKDSWNMTAIAKNDFSNQFSIYPVPANNDEIHIYFKSNLSVDKVTLYNVNGQVVAIQNKPTIENKELVFKALKPGFYFITLQVGQTTITRKVIVN